MMQLLAFLLFVAAMALFMVVVVGGGAVLITRAVRFGLQAALPATAPRLGWRPHAGWMALLGWLCASVGWVGALQLYWHPPPAGSPLGALGLLGAAGQLGGMALSSAGMVLAALRRGEQVRPWEREGAVLAFVGWLGLYLAMFAFRD